MILLCGECIGFPSFWTQCTFYTLNNKSCKFTTALLMTDTPTWKNFHYTTHSHITAHTGLSQKMAH